VAPEGRRYVERISHFWGTTLRGIRHTFREDPAISENQLQSELDLARGGGVKDLHESRSVNVRAYRTS